MANPFTEEELEKCIRDFHTTDWAGTCPTITILRLFATIRKLKNERNLLKEKLLTRENADVGTM